MKKWENPSVEELTLAETEHNWFGIYRDGGYIGDGIISGHLSLSKPEDPSKPGEGGNGSSGFQNPS